MMYTLVNLEGEEVSSLVTFDAVTSVDEKWTATVTTQVVESGFNISDSVTIEPPTFTLSGIISSYSIFNKDGEISWNGSSFLPKEVQDEERHIAVKRELTRLLKQGSLLTLLETDVVSTDDDMTTAYKESKSGWFNEEGDCIITSLSFSHPESGTGAYIVNLELQKVFVALVHTQELKDDEVVASLTPYYTPKTSSGSSGSSKTSKTEAGDATSIDEVINASEDLEDDKPVTKTWEWNNAKNASEQNKRAIKEQIRAYKTAINYMEMTDGIADPWLPPKGSFR